MAYCEALAVLSVWITDGSRNHPAGFAGTPQESNALGANHPPASRAPLLEKEGKQLDLYSRSGTS
jgi:hypothetical protein